MALMLPHKLCFLLFTSFSVLHCVKTDGTFGSVGGMSSVPTCLSYNNNIIITTYDYAITKLPLHC